MNSAKQFLPGSREANAAPAPLPSVVATLTYQDVRDPHVEKVSIRTDLRDIASGVCIPVYVSARAITPFGQKLCYCAELDKQTGKYIISLRSIYAGHTSADKIIPQLKSDGIGQFTPEEMIAFMEKVETEHGLTLFKEAVALSTRFTAAAQHWTEFRERLQCAATQPPEKRQTLGAPHAKMIETKFKGMLKKVIVIQRASGSPHRVFSRRHALG